MQSSRISPYFRKPEEPYTFPPWTGPPAIEGSPIYVHTRHACARHGAHSMELQGRLGQKIQVARTDWQAELTCRSLQLMRLYSNHACEALVVEPLAQLPSPAATSTPGEEKSGGLWETCRCQVLEPGEGLKELSPALGSKCRPGHRNKGTWPSLHATAPSSEWLFLGLAWLGGGVTLSAKIWRDGNRGPDLFSLSNNLSG